jgi:tetratricopeptide (TPR) repeat protein
MEIETAGLRQRRSKQAVELAMQGRWREAAAINQSLVESFPADVNAYNRLGRAYMEIGDFSHAWEAYSRAMELDPYNTIARKNLDRLSLLRDAIIVSPDDSGVEPLNFIEETGKAGVVNLYHLGPPEVVAKMVAGDKIYLKIKENGLVVENGRGEYLGQIELKAARRLIRLMRGGNEYTAAVVSITEDSATIIIREVYQHPSQVGRLSFPAKEFKSPRPYISDRVTKHELELEYEEEPEVVEEEESGYTIVGVEDKELTAGEPTKKE